MDQKPLNHLHILLIFLFILLRSPPMHCQLDYSFYNLSCPGLTRVVRNGVWAAMRNETRIAASLLRMHFHDCFVNGCDGSLLLDETSDMSSEKNAKPNNNSVRGFEVIDKIKAEVEKMCPSMVSCADILTLASRDAVYLSGGMYWPVALGRRDGRVANQTAANNEIPSPFDSLEKIRDKFAAKGLGIKDVVVLSGAHTIGFAQCFTFKNRLFNFNSSGEADPSLDSTMLKNLQTQCPDSDDSDHELAPLDSVTKNTFDNVYFKNLMNNSGLLHSDQVLMEDSETASMVSNYSKYSFLFSKDFGASMVKLGNVGVLTGDEGEIRTNCRVVN
ncbi:hypothetical protein J5N97_029048 [Dioscorea zingiberensis]|uniref:Peroxidase n=1 Tax=Dioscorea zingiberensis TaxID=325984 RepID=A0A9D5C034_9LILI|nr:hypothetical protein J5N97_029048 [Dioscorea zingiberensis]